MIHEKLNELSDAVAAYDKTIDDLRTKLAPFLKPMDVNAVCSAELKSLPPQRVRSEVADRIDSAATRIRELNASIYDLSHRLDILPEATPLIQKLGQPTNLTNYLGGRRI